VNTSIVVHVKMPVRFVSYPLPQPPEKVSDPKKEESPCGPVASHRLNFFEMLYSVTKSYANSSDDNGTAYMPDAT